MASSGSGPKKSPKKAGFKSVPANSLKILKPREFALDSLANFESLFGHLSKEQQQRMRADLHRAALHGMADRREDALLKFIEKQSGKKGDWPTNDIRWMRRPVLSRHFEPTNEYISRVADSIILRATKKNVPFRELGLEEQKRVLRLMLRFSERMVLGHLNEKETQKTIEFRKGMETDIDAMLARIHHKTDLSSQLKGLARRFEEGQKQLESFNEQEASIAQGLMSFVSGITQYYLFSKPRPNPRKH